ILLSLYLQMHFRELAVPHCYASCSSRATDLSSFFPGPRPPGPPFSSFSLDFVSQKVDDIKHERLKITHCMQYWIRELSCVWHVVSSYDLEQDAVLRLNCSVLFVLVFQPLI
ncbi:hypothetical protein CRENBAI_021906, partial [Crenichthys baileyi]